MKLHNCNNPVAQVVKTLTDRFEKKNTIMRFKVSLNEN